MLSWLRIELIMKCWTLWVTSLNVTQCHNLLNICTVLCVYICSSSSGRQLLVDFRHIRRWLLSPELGLSQSAVELLSSLPALSEMERGLLDLCGTADEVDARTATEPGEAWKGLTYASDLPVCRDQAWAMDKDWSSCSV